MIEASEQKLAVRQIAFKRGYHGRLEPVYRHDLGGLWLPTAQHSVSAPKDAGTPGYAKWQKLFSAGYEVVRL